MAVTIRSADFQSMTAGERDEVLSAAFASSAADLRIYYLTVLAKVRKFELRYEMSSDDLPAALASERIRETADVCDWMFWSDLRKRLEQARLE